MPYMLDEEDRKKRQTQINTARKQKARVWSPFSDANISHKLRHLTIKDKIVR